MLNLHEIVRPAINANYEDAEFTLYRAESQTAERGVVTAAYRVIAGITGNFQSEGDAALDHAEMAGQNTITRKLYLFADSDPAARPWSIYRPLGRAGDYLLDARGRYWKVVAVLEDFSDAGWECLRVTLQQVAPVLAVIDETASAGAGGAA